MYRKVSAVLLVLTLVFVVLAAGAVLAEGYPWRDHASPFDFLFGNHIDTHQQSQVSGRGQLAGHFYIKFTGNVTADGYPEAVHADCGMNPDECTVGWELNGVPAEATLLAHHDGQHPTWCVDAADLPKAPGYSHFHWLGAPSAAKDLIIGDTYEGYLLKLTARETFFFQHHGGFLVTPGIDNLTHANVVTNCGQ